ncbi:MAG: 16S rRNA (cytosine(1402)-N(4))-methyltransferase RsmH [Enterobacteriaceae bacterium]
MHIPVLFKELINVLNIKKNGIYVDCTFGAGGHSFGILSMLGKNGKLFIIDRDEKSIKLAKKKIKDERVFIINDTFSNIMHYVYKYNIFKKVNGIILDLGVSSDQLNNPKRGFSFMKNGPIDMRMNNKVGVSAKKWIKNASLNNLENVIKYLGEEKHYKKISKSIFNNFKKKKINTTIELSNIIKKATKKYKNKKKIHPATKTFRAIRMYINDELNELNKILNNIKHILSKRGKILIITFNSLEARIIKNFIKESKINKTKNKYFFKVYKKIKPSRVETIINPRSRSAILRCIKKIKF